jgi:DNA-binding NarL/FixJ family response regulator
MIAEPLYELCRVHIRAWIEDNGLELYRHRPTDLVITDIGMPELNGLDVTLELTREFLIHPHSALGYRPPAPETIALQYA